MLASSQGDSSFHFYWIRNSRPRPRHLGSFLIDGVGDTDGVHYVRVRSAGSIRWVCWWYRMAKHRSRTTRVTSTATNSTARRSSCS